MHNTWIVTMSLSLLASLYCCCVAAAVEVSGAEHARDSKAVHDVTKYGAIGDGSLESAHGNTAAFAKAFAAAKEGGTIVVPAGVFYSGPITFTADGQTLQLNEGSRLVAAWSAYGNMHRKNFSLSWPLGPKRPEGPPKNWDDQYAPFVYAKNHSSISLIGPGILDGGGEAWWNLKDKTSKKKFPKSMKGRPFVVRFDGCQDVEVNSLTMVQPPFWNLVPTWVKGFRVYNVTILATPGISKTTPYNTDGIEPMYTTDVHIKDCFIVNGDDSITIKSGTRNVLVEDCVFQDGHGANIGSVQGEDIVNVTYRNIKINNTLLGGGRIKARHYQDYWVTVRDVLFENISCVEGAKICSRNEVAEIDMVYGGGPFGKGGGTVINATWRNINVTGNHAGSFSCLRGQPCKGITLENVHIAGVKDDYVCSNVSGSSRHTVPTGKCLNSSGMQSLLNVYEI